MIGDIGDEQAPMLAIQCEAIRLRQTGAIRWSAVAAVLAGAVT
jgi:hypothetical protein